MITKLQELADRIEAMKFELNRINLEFCQKLLAYRLHNTQNKSDSGYESELRCSRDHQEDAIAELNQASINIRKAIEVLQGTKKRKNS